MIRRIYISFILILSIQYARAQYTNLDGYSIWRGRMSIGTAAIPNSSVHLQLGDSATTKALWLPRAQNTSAVSAPRQGMFIYSISDSSIYYRVLNGWVKLAAGSGGSPSDTSVWRIGGNNTFGISTTPPFGTLNSASIDFITNGIRRMRLLNTGISDGAQPGLKLLAIDTTNNDIIYSTRQTALPKYRFGVTGEDVINTSLGNRRLNMTRNSLRVDTASNFWFNTWRDADTSKVSLRLSFPFAPGGTVRGSLESETPHFKGSVIADFDHVTLETTAKDSNNFLTDIVADPINGATLTHNKGTSPNNTVSSMTVIADSIYIQPWNGRMNIDSLRAATDTTLSKPMVWNPVGGRWQYLPYWPSGGGGSTNSNIGSGYRWAVAGTNNIKTFFPGYGTLLDSTTNANALTIKADTATLSGKYVRVSDSATLAYPTGYLKGKQFLGDWVNTTFPGVSLPSDWLNFGASFSVNDGLILTGNGGGICTGFVYNTKSHCSQNYTQVMEFTLTTKPPSTSEGIYTGKRSTNTNAQLQNAILTKRYDATHWFVEIHIFNGCLDSIVATSDTIQMNNGDNYRIYVAYSQTNIYTRFARLNGSNVEIQTAAAYYKYSTIATDLVQPANTGAPWISAIGTGASYKVTSLVEHHYDLAQSDVIFIGNSIGTRFDATSLKNHYSTLSMYGSNMAWSTLAGGGDRTVDIILRVQEIISLQPKYVIIESGTNDNAVNLQADLETLFDSLQAHGIIPIFLKLFTDATKTTAAYAACQNKGVQIIDAGRANITVPNHSAHPTDLGMQIIAYIIQSEVPFATGHTGGGELSTLQGLGDVDPTGIVTGNALLWNSTSRKFLPGSPSTSIAIGTTPITGGAAKQVLFEDNSNKAFSNSNFVNDYINGWIGMRTSTPKTGLDINSSIRVQGMEIPATGAGLLLDYTTGVAHIRAYNSSGGAFEAINMGKDDKQIVLLSNGNVGIGNTTPSSMLSVGSSDDFQITSAGKITKYNNSSITDGQILIGHTSNGTFEKATITAGTGISVTNGAGSITIATSGFSSGTYTPTVTAVTNTSSVTAGLFHYIVSGSEVSFSGYVNFTTTAAVASEIGISLPGSFTSAFGNANEAAGVGNASSAVGANGYVQADATNDRLSLKFLGLAISGTGSIYVSGHYTIILP